MIWPNLNHGCVQTVWSFNLGPFDIKHRNADTYLSQERPVHTVIKQHFGKQTEMFKNTKQEKMFYGHRKTT